MFLSVTPKHHSVDTSDEGVKLPGHSLEAERGTCYCTKTWSARGVRCVAGEDFNSESEHERRRVMHLLPKKDRSGLSS